MDDYSSPDEHSMEWYERHPEWYIDDYYEREEDFPDRNIVERVVAEGIDTQDCGYIVLQYTNRKQEYIVMEGDAGGMGGFKTTQQQLDSLIGKEVRNITTKFVGGVPYKHDKDYDKFTYRIDIHTVDIHGKQDVMSFKLTHLGNRHYGAWVEIYRSDWCL